MAMINAFPETWAFGNYDFNTNKGDLLTFPVPGIHHRICSMWALFGDLQLPFGFFPTSAPPFAPLFFPYFSFGVLFFLLPLYAMKCKVKSSPSCCQTSKKNSCADCIPVQF